MNTDRIAVEKDKGVATVWLSRPEKLNALDMPMCADLSALFGSLEDDPSVRVVVVSGRGRAFCAGRDLRERDDREIMESVTGNLRAPWGANLYNFMKPVVAAVNGVCLGAGLDIAIYADIRLASNKAVFGYTEVDYGMVTGSGGVQILSRLVGAGEASYLVLTGERISAEKALEIGLVHRVCDPEDLLSEAQKLALRLAQKPPWAMMYAKQILRQGWELTREGSMRNDALVAALLRTTPDRQAGIESFGEKGQSG